MQPASRSCPTIERGFPQGDPPGTEPQPVGFARQTHAAQFSPTGSAPAAPPSGPSAEPRRSRQGSFAAEPPQGAGVSAQAARELWPWTPRDAELARGGRLASQECRLGGDARGCVFARQLRRGTFLAFLLAVETSLAGPGSAERIADAELEAAETLGL